MSIISGNIFPNTTFPDSLQTLPVFEDLREEEQITYSRYIKALLDGNFELANNYLEQLNPDSMITAQSLNVLSDTIGAVQTLYSTSEIFSSIINGKQSEWENILNRFGYVGEWIQPTIFSSAIAYAENSVVLYNNKMWIRNSNTSTSNPVPQDGSAYWNPYYRKNTLVSLIDASINQKMLYIALTDISTINSPYVDFLTEQPQWFKITLQGTKGENGEGFSFKSSWLNNVTYTLGDLIIYNGMCYSSLQNNNLNHTPSTSTTWWKKEFATDVVKIPVQSNTPDNQENGDIWFQLIDLV